MKNYSELIRSKEKRQLSAKGNKFVWRCIDLVAKQNNTSRYCPSLREVKKKLQEVLYFLILDKECSIEEIKEMIKNRKVKISDNLIKA